ncbi:hypothetical protein EZS27_009456 [termite gut metagenome]|uniref:Uncharacterized protein n=1 Tax=termite gut metagenome TaxID=433724 RepID=A0A5J4S9I5_9ZZZZ
MEKKFMKYLLFGVFTFVLGIAFVGCGEDYDDDISSLNNKTATLQSAIDALNTAKTELQNQISAVKGDAAAEAVLQAKAAAVQAVADALKNLDVKAGEYTLTEVGTIIGQLQALNLEERITGIESLLDGLEGEDGEGSAGAIIEHARKIAALELQIAALDGYGKGETVKAEIAELKALIASGIDLTDEQLDQIVEQLKASGLGDLVTLDQVKGLITGISLVNTVDNPIRLVGVTSRVTKDYTDADGKVFSFEANKISPAAKQDIYVQVTPATVPLDKLKDKISLINSKGEDAIKDYIIVKDVEVAKDYVVTTRADFTTGIFKVTLALNPSFTGTAAQKEAFDKIVRKGGKDLRFALAVENTVSTTASESRYVLTDFAIPLDADADPASGSVYSVKSTQEIGFTFGGTPVAELHNAYLENNTSTHELVWKGTTASSNTNPAANTEPAGVNDGRYAKAIKNIELGKAYELEITAPALGKVWGYYLGFDTQNANNSLWTNDILTPTVGTLYELSTNPSVTITLSDPKLQGAEIGLRVYLVNYDGTLVDPDGRAFYVRVNRTVSEGASLVFSTVFTRRTTDSPSVAVETGVIDINYKNLANANLVVGYEVVQDGKFEGTFGKANLKNNTSADWGISNGTIKITDLNPQKLKDNDVTTVGKLLLTDASGAIVISYDLNVRKDLPSFPSTLTLQNVKSASGDVDHSIGLKNTVTDRGTSNIEIIPKWKLGTDAWGASTTDIEATFNFGTAAIKKLFNNITTEAEAAIISINIDFIGHKGLGIKDSTITITKEAVSNPYTNTQYVATFTYNYGKIKYNSTSDYKVVATALSLKPSVQILSFLRGYHLTTKDALQSKITTAINLLNATATPLDLTGNLEWAYAAGTDPHPVYSKLTESSNVVDLDNVVKKVLAPQTIAGTLKYKIPGTGTTPIERALKLELQTTSTTNELTLNLTLPDATHIAADIAEIKEVLGGTSDTGGTISFGTLKDILGGEFQINSKF